MVVSKIVKRGHYLLLLMVQQQVSVLRVHKIGDECYKGMIIGIHQRPSDLEVNVCKTKALTNMRSATKGITTGIVAPVEMSLDACVEYLAADEILEVTPTKFRMAKNPAMAEKRKGRKN